MDGTPGYHRKNALSCLAFLSHPANGGTFEGRALLFVWDFKDISHDFNVSTLIIKKRFPGQTAAEAFETNDSVVERRVEFVQFAWLDVAELGEVRSQFVWAVAAEVDAADGQAARAIFSEARSFSCAGGRVEVGLRGVQTLDAAERTDARPKKPKVPKGRASACPNGDFEAGSFGNWQAFTGSRQNKSSIYLNTLSSGFVSGRHDIVTAGPDPLLASKGINLSRTGEGSFAARIGNSAAGGDADLLAYTFIVNPQNQYFTFRYALVLEDGGHTASEQPYFCYYVVPGSSIFWSPSNMPVASRQIVAEATPFFKQASGGIVYRDWTPVCIDLRAHMGKTMTIVFGVTDCAQGAHFGYAYIDGLCVSNQATASFTMPLRICANTALWADGSASVAETSHFWSIEESDSAWGRRPQTEVYEWFIAKQAGPINLTALYASKGGKFKCNTYYRIKLAVTNDCTPWNEQVQLLYVHCPRVNAGPDLCVSCTPNGKTIRLGSGSNHPQPGHLYNWSPSQGLSAANVPRPLHTEGSVAYPITYTLTVVDADGCSAEDKVTLYCKPPSVTLEMIRSCCTVTLIARAQHHSSLKWSTGQSGTESIEVSTPGTYTVMVTNACASSTATVTVPPMSGLSGPFNPVAAESRVGSSPLPNAMHVKDVIVGSPPGIAGAPHAYNATAYRLEIFDRWGQVIRTIENENCNGYSNWDIRWDTTDNWGSEVPQGTYTWRLELKNCGRNWTTPAVRRFKKRTCVRWWINIFGVKLFCREWDIPYGTTEDVPGGVDSVTVVR